MIAPMTLGVRINRVNQNNVKLMQFSGGMEYNEKRATTTASRVPKPIIEIGRIAMLLVIASMKRKRKYEICISKS
jgi:hypothetical protein